LNAKPFTGITAAGTVTDSNGIPFSTSESYSHWSPKRWQNYKKTISKKNANEHTII